MLRAGPFSDERVVRLANRRFIPFYFDLSDRGAAGDPDARMFVTAKRKELAGMSVPTPPVLLMCATGAVVGEVSNYADPEDVLRAMQKALREHPGCDKPTAEELNAKGVERAEIRIDLGDVEGARRILEGETGEEARYLLGRLARHRRDWEAMERAFAGVRSGALADDVRVERAWRLWHAREFEKLLAHLKDFPKASRRFTEARYLKGLAAHHLGKKDEALEIWKETIAACAQDPWIYRADWAYSSVKDGDRRVFVAGAKGSSLLGRIGYMGGANPDLKGPRE